MRSTVLKKRITFGEWVLLDGKRQARTYINNHYVGQTVNHGGFYTIFNENGYSFSRYSIMELLPFIGYSLEGTEF